MNDERICDAAAYMQTIHECHDILCIDTTENRLQMSRGTRSSNGFVGGRSFYIDLQIEKHILTCASFKSKIIQSDCYYTEGLLWSGRWIPAFHLQGGRPNMRLENS